MNMRIGNSSWVDANGHLVVGGAKADRESVKAGCERGIKVIDDVLESNRASVELAKSTRRQDLDAYNSCVDSRNAASERIASLRQEGFRDGFFGRCMGYKHAAEIERLESASCKHCRYPDPTWVIDAKFQQERFRTLARSALIGTGDLSLTAEAVQLLGSVEDGSLESKWQSIAKRNDPTF